MSVTQWEKFVAFERTVIEPPLDYLLRVREQHNNDGRLSGLFACLRSDVADALNLDSTELYSIAERGVRLTSEGSAQHVVNIKIDRNTDIEPVDAIGYVRGERNRFYVDVQRVRFKKSGHYDDETNPAEVQQWIDPEEMSEWEHPESWALPGKYIFDGRRLSVTSGDILSELSRPLGPMVPCYSIGVRIVIRSQPEGSFGMLLTGCSGTIHEVDSSGRYTISIDNAKVEDGAPLLVCLPLCQWDHTLAQPYDRYQSGDQLVVADGFGGWIDAVVVDNLGQSEYQIDCAGRKQQIVLNSANHAVSEMSRTEYADALVRYLRKIAQTSNVIMDGITGNKLETERDVIQVGIRAADLSEEHYYQYERRAYYKDGTLRTIGFSNVEDAASLSAALRLPVGAQCSVLTDGGESLGGGVIRFIGSVSGNAVVGVELHAPLGGSEESIKKLFKCKEGHGVLIQPHELELVESIEPAAPLSPQESADALIDSSGCVHGAQHGAAVLVRAAPGTGKTVLTIQVQHFAATRRGRPATSCVFVPYLVEMKRLAYEMRAENGSSKTPNFEGDPLEWYILKTHEDSTECSMLLDAYRRRRLLIILDGIDEAPELRCMIETFLAENLARNGHRFVATTRPEAVRSGLYRHRFVVLDLAPYAEDQQRAVLSRQIRGQNQDFVTHLFNYIHGLREMDRLYAEVESDAGTLLQIESFDTTVLPNGYYDPGGRQVSALGRPIESVKDLREIAQFVKTAYDDEMKRIVKELGLPVANGNDQLRDNGYVGLCLADIKQEGRCEEKSRDKYQPDIDQGFRDGPAPAWLIDVVRSSVLCRSPSQMVSALNAIQTSEIFTIIRIKNYFLESELDPVHFRRIGITVLVAGSNLRPPHRAEIQIHLSTIYKFKTDQRDLLRLPFEYFRTKFGNRIENRLGDTSSPLNGRVAGWMSLDERVKTWGSFLCETLHHSLPL